jgi:hypothetical protein
MIGYWTPRNALRCRLPGADFSTGMKLARLLLVKQFASRKALPEGYLAGTVRRIAQSSAK